MAAVHVKEAYADFCLLMLISVTRKTHAPAIAAIATRARAIALWTASLVLSAPAEQRIEALTWVLQLLRASFELHNHACCVAMLAGLQLPCVAALRPLWAAVSDTSAVTSHALITAIFLPDHDWLCAYHQKLFLRRPVSHFTNMTSNVALREQQHRVRGPWDPYLAPLLCDLLQIEVDMPHMTTQTPPMLNVTKLRNMAALLSQVHAVQHEPLTGPAQLVTSLHDHLQSAPHHDEDQLTARSTSIAASLQNNNVIGSSEQLVLVPWLAYLEDTAGITYGKRDADVNHFL